MEARRQQLLAMLAVCTDPERKKWLEQLVAACVVAQPAVAEPVRAAA